MYEISQTHREQLDQNNQVHRLFTVWKKDNPDAWDILKFRLQNADPHKKHWTDSQNIKPNFGFALAILYDWRALPENMHPGLMMRGRKTKRAENDFNWMHGVLRDLYTAMEKELRWRKIEAKKNNITWIEPNKPHPNPPPEEPKEPEQLELILTQDPVVQLTVSVKTSKVAAIMAIVNS